MLSSILCFLRLWTQCDHNLKTLKIQISHESELIREICGRYAEGRKALKLVKNGDYLSFLFYLCTINYS